jgi:hypothetical protein
MVCRNETLKELLEDYREFAGLSVHWVVVGSDGRETRPTTGGVLQSYSQCAGQGRHIVKTIANTYFLRNVATHPHNFEFRSPLPAATPPFCSFTPPV